MVDDCCPVLTEWQTHVLNSRMPLLRRRAAEQLVTANPAVVFEDALCEEIQKEKKAIVVCGCGTPAYYGGRPTPALPPDVPVRTPFGERQAEVWAGDKAPVVGAADTGRTSVPSRAGDAPVVGAADTGRTSVPSRQAPVAHAKVSGAQSVSSSQVPSTDVRSHTGAASSGGQGPVAVSLSSSQVPSNDVPSRTSVASSGGHVAGPTPVSSSHDVRSHTSAASSSSHDARSHTSAASSGGHVTGLKPVSSSQVPLAQAKSDASLAQKLAVLKEQVADYRVRPEDFAICSEYSFPAGDAASKRLTRICGNLVALGTAGRPVPVADVADIVFAASSATEAADRATDIDYFGFFGISDYWRRCKNAGATVSLKSVLKEFLMKLAFAAFEKAVQERRNAILAADQIRTHSVNIPEIYKVLADQMIDAAEFRILDTMVLDGTAADKVWANSAIANLRELGRDTRRVLAARVARIILEDPRCTYDKSTYPSDAIVRDVADHCDETTRRITLDAMFLLFFPNRIYSAYLAEANKISWSKIKSISSAERPRNPLERLIAYADREGLQVRADDIRGLAPNRQRVDQYPSQQKREALFVCNALTELTKRHGEWTPKDNVYVISYSAVVKCVVAASTGYEDIVTHTIDVNASSVRYNRGEVIFIARMLYDLLGGSLYNIYLNITGG